MRIERTGSANLLTPRVKRFITEAIGGRDLDNIQHAEERRADYACLNSLLAIELKSLEESPSGRMDNLIEELRQREDWPEFLGSAPLNSFVKHLAHIIHGGHRV
jgi:hypothetical protein